MLQAAAQSTAAAIESGRGVPDEARSKQSLRAVARVPLLDLTAVLAESETALESPKEATADPLVSDDAIASSTPLPVELYGAVVAGDSEVSSNVVIQQTSTAESNADSPEPTPFPLADPVDLAALSGRHVANPGPADPIGLAGLQLAVSAAYAQQVEQRRQQVKASDALEQPAAVANAEYAEPSSVPNHTRLARADIAAGSAHTLVRFSLPSGETVVYSWGSADRGQLGHGNLETQRTPKLVQALKGVRVAQLAAGYACTAAVTTVGNLYVWGDHQSAPQLMYHSTRMSTSPHAVAFRTDLNGLHALTADGSTLAVDCGAMVRTSSVLDLLKATPETVPELMRIHELREQCVVSCGCGAKHVAIATSQGVVWTWGQGEHGALGLGSSTDRSLPEVVTDLQRAAVAIARVGCGGFMTFALSDNGDLFTWGRGPLGHVPSEAILLRPKVVNSIDHEVILAAACGEDHMLALSDEGQVFAWGLAANGRLGLGDIAASPADERTKTYLAMPNLRAFRESHSYAVPPQRIDFLEGKGIVAIACGAMHSAAISDEGCVYTWGCGKDYALGHGDSCDVWKPQALLFLNERLRQLKLSPAQSEDAGAESEAPLGVRHRRRLGTATIGGFRPVASGQGHNVALDEKGAVWTWGLGSSGQLGHSDAFDSRLPRCVAYFSSIRIHKARSSAAQRSRDSHLRACHRWIAGCSRARAHRSDRRTRRSGVHVGLRRSWSTGPRLESSFKQTDIAS